jgi:hypothetical protein
MLIARSFPGSNPRTNLSSQASNNGFPVLALLARSV